MSVVQEGCWMSERGVGRMSELGAGRMLDE